MLSRFQPQALSIVRIVAGYLFLLHGWQKAFGWFGGLPPDLPGNVVTMLKTAGWIETVGGVFILLGLFTAPAAFVLCGEMAVAYFTGHVARNGNFFLPLMNEGEPAVLFCFIYLFFSSAGGGAWSLDRMLGRDKPAKP
ncbi:MAG TPA: DoxX family protein [Bryobacteraceae bacterium]|nr:DoxX family protein [Bryobacteraceae bacterium]